MPTESGTPPLGIPAVLAPLEDDLRRVGIVYREILGDITEHSAEILRPVTRFAGKRLRPALTLTAARIAGDDATTPVVTVAAIVELIHTATLVHDDVIDAADVRRQRTTVNAQSGDQLAVLAGDVLFTKAYRAAADLEDRFASRYLSAVVDEILEGEIHQDLVTRSPELPEADYRRIIRGKTAALYEGAMVVGAHYGGRPDLGESLGRFGHHLGMAFQIVDDRLDLTGDESEVGKTLGRDLGEGKMTLPLILWRENHSPETRAEGLALIEKAWDDEGAAQRLGRRLVEDGALAATDAAAEAEVKLATDAVAAVKEGPEKTLLETLARFVLDRRS